MPHHAGGPHQQMKPPTPNCNAIPFDSKKPASARVTGRQPGELTLCGRTASRTGRPAGPAFPARHAATGRFPASDGIRTRRARHASFAGTTESSTVPLHGLRTRSRNFPGALCWMAVPVGKPACCRLQCDRLSGRYCRASRGVLRQRGVRTYKNRAPNVNPTRGLVSSRKRQRPIQAAHPAAAEPCRWPDRAALRS